RFTPDEDQMALINQNSNISRKNSPVCNLPREGGYNNFFGDRVKVDDDTSGVQQQQQQAQLQQPQQEQQQQQQHQQQQHHQQQQRQQSQQQSQQQAQHDQYQYLQNPYQMQPQVATPSPLESVAIIIPPSSLPRPLPPRDH
ncbi:hypothetical protein BGZ94_006733, partial [Podila epigama]